MARHYSPRSFFRHAPNAMLKRYFDKQGVLTGHDFSGVSETKIEPIYQAWLTLPDAQRGEMERDFREIDALACEGGVKAIMDEADWHDENLADKGRKHNGQVTLLADGNSLALALGGHMIPLVDVLSFDKNFLALDKAALIRMMDNPAGKSEIESPDARKARLIARVNQEKAKGTRAFLQVVADEEGINVSRLKQIIYEKQKSDSTTTPANLWAGLQAQQKRPSSKKPQTKY